MEGKPSTRSQKREQFTPAALQDRACPEGRFCGCATKEGHSENQKTRGRGKRERKGGESAKAARREERKCRGCTPKNRLKQGMEGGLQNSSRTRN